MTETVQGPSGTRATVARTYDDVESLRAVWEVLPGGVVTSDIDAFVTTLRASEHAPTPYVLLLQDDAGAQALAICRFEEIVLGAKVGYRSVYSPKVRSITVVYGGVLGTPSAETAAALLERLREPLANGEADVVRFRNLRVGSPLHRIATTAPPFLSRQHVATRTAHWQLELPASHDDFLKSLSKSTREGVKRYSRKLDRDFGDRLTLELTDDADGLERFFADARTVAETTYQHGLGAAVTDDVAHRQLIELAARRGWFRAWMLSIDGKPAAFWHGMAYRNVFSIGVPGYDPEYGHLRVGTYVLMKAIEDLCNDDTVQTVDFGFGDAEYKRRFGTESWEEEDVLVYAPSFRGARVNLTRAAVVKTVGVAQGAVERLPALQGLKRSWRSRLSSSNAGGKASE